MKLAIIIAAYNEEKSIGTVLQSLPKSLAGIKSILPVVIDDGSTDRTEDIAGSFKNVHVLRHLINRGQGAALKTGFSYALKHGCDIAVTFDADGQHNPEDIPELISPILTGDAQVTLGSRFLTKNTENITKLRRWMLKGGVLFTRVISRMRVTDTHNGLRAFHRDALVQMRLIQDKMEHASEILDQISQHNIPYVEVPVTIMYSDYSKEKGQGDGNAFKIALKMIVHKIIS